MLRRQYEALAGPRGQGEEGEGRQGTGGQQQQHTEPPPQPVRQAGSAMGVRRRSCSNLMVVR